MLVRTFAGSAPIPGSPARPSARHCALAWSSFMRWTPRRRRTVEAVNAAWDRSTRYKGEWSIDELRYIRYTCRARNSRSFGWIAGI